MVGISLKFRSFSETFVAMGAKKIVVVPFREAKIFDSAVVIPFCGCLGFACSAGASRGTFLVVLGGALVLPTPRGDTVSLAMPRGVTMTQWCLARGI